MASGVKVVGGTGPPDRAVPDEEGPASDVAAGEPGIGPTAEVHGRTADRTAEGRRQRASRRTPGAGGRRRRLTILLACLAVLGIAGTVGFGLAWANLHAQASGEAQATTTARSFLVDLTNFDAKTVDADFQAITSMATGTFSTQAQRFFNSSIRQELEKALASSRGQVRALYVQSYGTGQATVYAVVDQLYANDKVTSPQTDVLRIVLTMAEVSGRWKVGDVTVLQGPSLSPASSSPTPKG